VSETPVPEGAEATLGLNGPPTLLLVDDNQTNLSVLVAFLGAVGYEIMVARSGAQALDLLGWQVPDLILLDVMLPGMDGFEICRRLKAMETVRDVPVIFMTALGDVPSKIRGFESGGVDYITKPFQQVEVLARVRTHVHLFQLNRQLVTTNHDLELRVRQRTQEIAEAYEATIRGWARALELRDQETHGHSERVVELTLALAARLGVPPAELEHVRRGALLHDIGKIGVPDAILFKPEHLLEAEWESIRLHPGHAWHLLHEIEYLKPALDIPWCHHEHWNGGGYPRGLKGTDIPLAARIFTVVDVWDALANQRPYHRPWPPAEIAEYLRQQSGIRFDPRVVDAFLAMLRERGTISMV
jgi:putative two-component system response regulator